MIGLETRKLYQRLLTLALLLAAVGFVGTPSQASMTAACGDCGTDYKTCSQSDSTASGVAACRDALATCASSCTPTGDDASSKCANKAQACHSLAEADYDVARESCNGDTDCISDANSSRATSHTACRTTEDTCSAAIAD